MLVAVAAVLWYCTVVLQTASAVQMRLLVMVAAVLWYCVELHTVSDMQMRLLVAVGAMLWYWVALQTVVLRQTVWPVEAWYVVGELQATHAVAGLESVSAVPAGQAKVEQAP